ncbi:MAG: hypothetical protein HZA54_20000 [Planctomycetes bacterium]|nr:hypothetical protein [Planctomycetota bacterium]
MTTPAYEEFRKLLRARAYAEAAALAERESVRRHDADAFWLTQEAVALTLADRAAEALGFAEKALAVAPVNRYALGARAEARLRLERWAEAAADFEELLRLPQPHSRVREGLLRALAGRADWPRLLERLDAWELPRPARLPWQVRALRGLGRADEALAACREWLALAKDEPPALWALAEIEVEREGLEPVRERYERLARIPSRPPVYREIYASLCRRAGREEEAIKVYAALGATDGNARAHRQQAFALAASGHEPEALPQFEEILRATPRDLYVLSAYEGACRRVDQLERAWKFYSELLALHPEEKGLYGRRRRIAGRLEQRK